MRNERIFVVGTLVLASAIAACGSSGGGEDADPAPSVGGAVAAGGDSSVGGTVATGGSSSSAGGVEAAGGSGNSVTTLSGTKTLGELLPAEATQLCSDIFAYYGKVIERASLCKWQGLSYSMSTSAATDAKLQEACTGKETTCLQSPPPSPSCGDLPSPCAVTVEQYSACIVDQATAFNEGVIPLAGCTTVVNGDKPAIWTFMSGNLPLSCTPSDGVCPGLNPPTPKY